MVWKQVFWRVAAAVALAAAAPAADWPQYQCTPDRKGYTPDTVAPPYAVAWLRTTPGERICGAVQAIVYDGKVFVPTMSGSLFAFDAATGEVAWKRAVAPTEIVHTVGCAEGKVVVPCMDGTVRAFAAADGTPLWVFDAGTGKGFSAAPCIAGGRIYIGSRRGLFYALALKDGEKIWEFDADAPLLNTAAFSDGRIFFGSEDMVLFCLNAADGRQAWKTEKMLGHSLSDYCPVVHKGRVFVRPDQYGNQRYLTDKLEPVMEGLLKRPSGVAPEQYHPGVPWLSCQLYGNYCVPIKYGEEWRLQQAAQAKKSPEELEVEKLIRRLWSGEMPPEIMQAQDIYVKFLEEHPEERRFFVFDEKTGALLPPFPDFHASGMTGNVPPPCVDHEGYLVIPWVYPNPCVARLDAETRRVVQILPAYAGANSDEIAAVSAGGPRIWASHYVDATIGLNGIFDPELKEWVLPTARMATRRKPVRFGFTAEAVEGLRRGYRAVTQAAAISNGMFYHIVDNQIAACKSAAGSAAAAAQSETAR